MWHFVKQFIPARFSREFKNLLGFPIAEPIGAGEKGPDYYNASFGQGDVRRRHYTESSYYFIWTVIVDRLRRLDAKSVLEIGCGPGQLAALIHDAGILENYRGFDFSERRILQARLACPALSFDVADAYKTDIFSSFSYDTAIATEFLEHVEGDLEVLSKLPIGTRFIGTVPNFPYISHVRHFASSDEVLRRYGQVLQSCSVVSFLENADGKTFFLIEGTRGG